MRKRLKTVTVSHAEGLVRSYVLEYVAAIGTWASLLREVHEIGNDGHTEAPVRDFTYPAMLNAMAPIAASSVPASTPTSAMFLLGPFVPTPQTLPATWTGAGSIVTLTQSDQAMYADVDGDGRADYLRFEIAGDCSTITTKVRLAGSMTDVTNYQQWTSFYKPDPILPPTCMGVAHTADLDGDGDQDLVFEIWKFI